MSLQKKRAASLPIFNRGKRPRQALLTHPNNVGGPSQQDAQWSASHCKTSAQGSQQRYTPPTSTQPSHGQIAGRGASMPPPASAYSQHMDKENVASVSKFRPFQGKQTGQVHVQREGNSSCGRLPPRSSSFGHHGNKPLAAAFGSRVNTPPAPMNHPPSHMVATTAPGRAVEPSKHYGAKLDPRSALTLLSHHPRVLTATVKGMQHWTQFKTHTPLIFEIFGTLNSTVMDGPLGAREFTVLTPDGPLRCLYWEMDHQLPHLVRGKAVRVVGTWDSSQQWLKCHSVRETSPDEQRCALQLVAISDAAMRATIARQPEM